MKAQSVTEMFKGSEDSLSNSNEDDLKRIWKRRMEEYYSSNHATPRRLREIMFLLLIQQISLSPESWGFYYSFTVSDLS